jgi:hypothetical protein
MNWQNIKVSADNTYFLFEETPIFNRKFIEVLKFHAPGLAPVKDDSGSYHINIEGKELYSERYSRTFGYYCNRTTVVKDGEWYHINEHGERSHKNSFVWAGNYQENLCTVRDTNNQYFHIDLNGYKIYSETFTYAGDFKDGIACVKNASGFCKHIDALGNYLNNIDFLDLGIFHKNFATAKDKEGWYHIDKQGKAIYKQRYLAIEPFYNGYALVTQFDNQKVIINEKGEPILKV